MVSQIELSGRGRIRVTGEDRARLLHAMCTNHVNNLVPGTGCYAFFLNAQGRILSDANILCFEDYFLLDVEPESRAFLLEHLDKFIIADDVVLEDTTGSTFAIGIEGEGAEEVLRNAGLPVPEAPLAHRSSDGLFVVRASSTGAPAFRVMGPAGETPKFHGTVATPAGAAKVLRLEHLFPRYGEDITNANLPQETGITDALNFNKGCYIGQEIVERVRSRGHVNRILVGLRIDAAEPPARGSKVVFEGAEVGEITSSAYSAAQGASFGMSYLRVNAARPGTAVSVAGNPAQVVAIKSSRT